MIIAIKNIKTILIISSLLFIILVVPDFVKYFLFNDVGLLGLYLIRLLTALVSGIIIWLCLKNKYSDRNFSSEENLCKNKSSTHKIIRELLRDQELFSLVFDTIPVGLWILDESGTIVQVNKSGIDLWGGAKYVKPEQYNIYKAWFMNSGRLIESGDWAAVRALKFGETSVNEEIKIERFDGEIKIVYNSALPLFDKEKKIIGVLVVNEDITERKRNEEQLLKLSLAIENSPSVTAITDIKGNLEYVNSLFTKSTGYTKEEVLGKNPRILNSGLLPDQFFRNLWATIRSGNVWEGELLNKKKNGDLYWEYALISPLVNHQNKTKYYVKVGNDITRRKKAEMALFESEERYRSLVEMMPDGVALFGFDFRLQMVNQKAVDLMGYENSKELIGRNALKFIANKSKAEIKEIVSKLLTTNHLTVNEYQLYKKDGSEFCASLNAAVINDTSKKPHSIICNFRDITEQKRAETELRSIKERLEFLVSSSPVVIYIANPGENFHFTYVSNNCQNIIGYPSEELIENHNLWVSLIHPEDKHLSGLDCIEKHKKEYSVYEYRLRLQDNNYYWFREDRKILFDTTGKSAAIVGSLINIHIRKTAEDEIAYRLELEKVLNKISGSFVEISDKSSAINSSLEKLGTAINADTCYLYEYGDNNNELSGVYEWLSVGYESLMKQFQLLLSGQDFDWLMKTMIKNEFLYLNNIDNLPEHSVRLKQFFKSNEIVSILAVPLLCLGKQYGFILFCYLKNSYKWNKEDINLIRTASDIISRGIERGIYENILLESEERFRTLVENVGEGVGMVDENEFFIFANPAANKIFGVDEEGLLKRNLMEFIAPDQWHIISEQTESRKFGNINEYELEITQPSGRKRNILVTSSPRFLQNGNYTGAFGVFRDITDRKTLEAKLHYALQKEKELNELKSRFISTASHEFKTPLTSVLASADLLEMFGKKWPEHKYLAHIKKIQNAVYNLTGIINDVLIISRVEKNKLEFNPEKTNLLDLCTKVIGEVEIDSKGRVDFKYLSNITFAMLDKKLLKLILTNLLSNSIKYSTSKVKLIVASRNNLFYLAVIDKGIGIPDQDKTSLFQPFFRGGNSNDLPGTGLGLSIVKHAVDKHNGTIKYKSIINKGTTFTVTIPVVSIDKGI